MPFCLCEVDVLRCGDSRLPPGSEITLPSCGGKLTLGLVPQPTAHTPAVQVAQCPELTQPLERGDRGPETIRGTPEVLLLALGPRLWDPPLWDPSSVNPALGPPLWDPLPRTTGSGDPRSRPPASRGPLAIRCPRAPTAE